ncbi:MAG TPA: M48 family metallopeptidase [Vicinamibacterales bacterium]|nr:M48 family metallopeptidase [Vicinamibacterales bacterium]
MPERLLANRVRKGVVLGFSFGLLAATAPDRLAWALPLLVVARTAAAYPLRKALYNETWSLFAYLSFSGRLIVAIFGFWILIALLPTLAMLAGSRDWIVAGALGAIAVLWSAWYSRILRIVLRTKPVDTPVLVSRFTQLVKDCGLSDVKLEQVPLGGGMFANAVALPSIHRPAVVVTDTVIARFDDDETTAILAHELAHLEYYNKRRLRKINAITYTLIVAGALLSPVLRLTLPQAMTAALVIWPAALMAAMLSRLRHRQKHETSSDLRAVALTGDGEALIRALIKLHAFARLPRRWDTELERRATHPSLARRIQAIRAASGTAPASLGEAATFTGAGTTESISFHDERLEWNERGSATHAINYGQLSELRIAARTSGTPRLVAVDAGKRRWELSLQPGDVARAQAILDIVDVRLGKAAEPSAVPLSSVRLLAWLAIAAAICIGQYSILIVGLLAMAQPASQLAAAAGVSALAAAALTWRDHALSANGDSEAWLALALLVCGVLLIGAAFANRHDPARPALRKLLVVLAASTALAWAAVAISEGDVIRSVREWPAVTVLALACAGALAFARPRAARWASVPVALAGLFSGFLGSASFADRIAHDPFVASARAVAMSTLTASPLMEFPVEFESSFLCLSPKGRYVALGSEDASDLRTIHAGLAGRPLADFMADDAVFVEEGRLLLLERQPHASVLRLVNLDAGDHDVWSLSVPLWWADLAIDRSSEQWRLLGWNAAGKIVSAEGHLGDDTVRQAEWQSPADSDDLDALGVSGGVVFALENHRLHSLIESEPLSTWVPFLRPGSRTEPRLWRVDDSARSVFATSRTDLSCRGSVLMDEPATCAAFDGTTTRFFNVEPRARRLTALASIAGRVTLHGEGDRGWVAGWWNRAPVLVRAATREAVRIPARTGERLEQLAIGNAVIAAVSWNERQSTVRLYPRP